MNKEIELYIERIKNAKTKDNLKQISYDFTKNTSYQIMSKECDLIDHLCVYKECLLDDNMSKKDLSECIKVFKLPKSLIKKVES